MRHYLHQFTTIVVVSFLLLCNNGVLSSALLNEVCQSTTECTIENSICGPLASICSPFGQFCQCLPDYAEDRGSCKIVAFYNEPCGDLSVCANGASHLVCNAAKARCECDIGYNPDFSSRPVTCVSSGLIGGLVGDDCITDPVDNCGKNLECLSGICTCKPSYMYDDAQDACVAIGLGDACIDDTDCSNVINAVCNSDKKTCHCPEGSASEAITYRNEHLHACLSPNDSPRTAGEICNEIGPAPNSYCAQPFACTQCTPNGSVAICTVGEVEITSTTSITSTTTVASSTTLILSPLAKDESPGFKSFKYPSTILSETENISTTVASPGYDYYTTIIPDNNYGYDDSVLSEPAIEEETVQKPLLGDACKRDEDCNVLFSMCYNGTCQCQDGYVDRNVTECLEYFDRVPLGNRCISDHCSTPHAICINSTCQCREGYKKGPKNDDCVQASRIYGYGDICSSTTECYYNLVCLQSRCLCSPGYKQSTFYECKKRVLQDACPSGLNIECRFINNATCSPNHYCQCAPGFTRQSATNCVPLIVVQAEERSWDFQVACSTSDDCLTSAAPKMSKCLQPTMKCGCPSESVFDENEYRCRYRAAESDHGFSCDTDSDCPQQSRCIRNICGGMLRAGGANRQAAVPPTYWALFLIASLLPFIIVPK